MDYRDFGMSKRSMMFWGLFECFLSIFSWSFWVQDDERFGERKEVSFWGTILGSSLGKQDEENLLMRSFVRSFVRSSVEEFCKKFCKKFCRGVNLVEEIRIMMSIFCRRVLSDEMSRTGWFLSVDNLLIRGVFSNTCSLSSCGVSFWGNSLMSERCTVWGKQFERVLMSKTDEQNVEHEENLL